MTNKGPINLIVAILALVLSVAAIYCAKSCDGRVPYTKGATNFNPTVRKTVVEPKWVKINRIRFNDLCLRSLQSDVVMCGHLLDELAKDENEFTSGLFTEFYDDGSAFMQTCIGKKLEYMVPMDCARGVRDSTTWEPADCWYAIGWRDARCAGGNFLDEFWKEYIRELWKQDGSIRQGWVESYKRKR